MEIFLVWTIPGLVLSIAFFWTIGAIRRNTAKAAVNSEITAGLRGREGDIQCPKCAEFIKSDAKICRHCGFAEVQSDASVRELRAEQLMERDGIRLAISAETFAKESTRWFFWLCLLLGLALIFTSGITDALFGVVGLVGMVVGLGIFLPRMRKAKFADFIMDNSSD